MRRISLFRTSSFRLTLLYAGLFTASVLVLFGTTYWSATSYAAHDQMSEIGIEFAAIQDEERLTGDGSLPAIIDNHMRQHVDVRAAYLLQDPRGIKMAGNIAAQTPHLGPSMISVLLGRRVRAIRANGYRLANGDYLLIGRDTFFIREMRELIIRAFGAGLAITLLLAGLGGAIISASALKRIESFSQTSSAIIGGDMTQRVPLRGHDDEFDHLAASLNAMLDRIEDLMRNIRQVSNDIAHDLRTPLTRLRQRLERALRRSHTVEELHETLGASIAQVDSILETFGALLSIAQIEAGGRATSPSTIDVSMLLAKIVEDFSPAAEDCGHRLVAEIEPGIKLSADRELLTQMVANLVDNAIRHSFAGTLIWVQGKLIGNNFEIAIADTGPGIPPEERENVLRPFYRLEASRTTEGSGLGLSLVAAIAKQHQAKLSLTDSDPGLRVAVLFPAAA